MSNQQYFSHIMINNNMHTCQPSRFVREYPASNDEIPEISRLPIRSRAGV
jgi:hypothetical protein